MKITKLDPAFSVSAQLTAADLAQLESKGFRCIVNNRPDGEEKGQPRSSELAAEAARLHMQYHHIPIVPGELTDSNARALAKVLANAGGPVLAFCRSGARSTKLWQRSRELPAKRN